MLYQIQKYNQTDHSNREVLAQSEDLIDQAAIQQWANANTPLKVDEGFAIANVPASHDWYIASNSESNEVVESETPTLSIMERPAASFAEVARYELERSQLERQQSLQE